MIARKSGVSSGKRLVFSAVSTFSLALALSGPAVAGSGDIVYTVNPPYKLLAAASRSAPYAFPTPSQCVAQAGSRLLYPGLDALGL